ncbi:hypothetical protein ACI2OX_17935 [Bacillus sp. N9]
MQLIAVTDDRMSEEELLKTLFQIEPYVCAVILREKSKTVDKLQLMIRNLSAENFDLNKLIIHNNPNLAVAMGISRVQLPSYVNPVKIDTLTYPSVGPFTL